MRMLDSQMVRWMREHGLTVRELARRLDVSEAAVYRWLCGSAVPTVHHLAVLEELSNGEIRARWFTSAVDGADGKLPPRGGL